MALYESLPHKQRFKELQHDYEAQRDQDKAQVEEQHKATHALHIRAEWVRRSHCVHFHPGLEGYVKTLIVLHYYSYVVSYIAFLYVVLSHVRSL